jgi:hypothetical protein
MAKESKRSRHTAPQPEEPQYQNLDSQHKCILTTLIFIHLPFTLLNLHLASSQPTSPCMD